LKNAGYTNIIVP